MDRTELIQFTRSQIDTYKKLGIPQLMRDKKLDELEEISKNVNYAPFEENPEPKFDIVDELHISGEDDAATVSFLRWGNPYVKRGKFYNDWFKTMGVLANDCGKLGREIADVENCKSLSKFYGRTTIEELCGMVYMPNE